MAQVTKIVPQNRSDRSAFIFLKKLAWMVPLTDAFWMKNLIAFGVLIFLTACSACTSPPLARTPQTNAGPDSVSVIVEPPRGVGGSPILTVTSWNVKRLGRNLFDPRQASPMLADADIATFQEVNTNASGVESLRGIAEQLSTLTKEKICVAVSERPTDGKEVYGYIWKQSRVAFVSKEGRVITDCGSGVFTIRLGVRYAEAIKREPAFGTFYFRPTGKPFVLASIHLLPKAKKPQQEVAPLFSTFRELTSIPVIVAGDFNLDSSHASFAAAREIRFEPAMVNVKTSLKRSKRELSEAYDNFWFRGLKQVGTPRVINLYEAFPEKDQREIYNNFSDHCPITARFEFE